MERLTRLWSFFLRNGKYFAVSSFQSVEHTLYTASMLGKLESINKRKQNKVQLPRVDLKHLRLIPMIVMELTEHAEKEAA